VTPANILLARDGRVLLADFGIARLAADTARLTAHGLMVGTVGYLSPEQVTGGDVGPAADVYALGLTLLEALTGAKAYPGPAAEAALARLTASPAISGNSSATVAGSAPANDGSRSLRASDRSRRGRDPAPRRQRC
jgi:eukaryotic-like serine/threonine-protein kinase